MRLISGIAGYAGVVGLFTLSHMNLEPYDDAAFFKRIALNALEHGTLAWNADEGPAYGSTSQLYQWLALPIAALAGDHYMLCMRLAAALCLVTGFALLLQLTRDLDGGMATAMTFASPIVLYAVLSGMETALVLAVLSIYLSIVYGQGAERRHWALAPAVVWVVYLTRPDAILLIVPPLLLERGTRAQRVPLREAALIAALIGATLLAFRIYYGTALPLPFYAKQSAFSPYDSNFIEVTRQARNLHFGLFSAFAAPNLLLALQRRDRTNLILLGSVAAFCTYHLLFTIEVMGMHARFYAPAMPLLALAAARGASDIAKSGAHRTAVASTVMFVVLFLLLWFCNGLPKNTGFRLERVDLVMYAIMVPALAVSCLASAWEGWQKRATKLVLVAALCSSAARLRADSFHLNSDEDFLALEASHCTVYRGLDTLRACFGERIHIYHSDVGLPGLRLRHGKVTDLAGLLSPKWLFRTLDFDAICNGDRPEAIFLPHKNYAVLRREIVTGQCIRGYVRAVESSSSPLYVRADLYPRFQACARDHRDPYASKAPLHPSQQPASDPAVRPVDSVLWLEQRVAVAQPNVETAQ